MRVIAGSARSMPLKTIEGLDTRPTTDRIKETLFNMLQMDVPGARFLDLFSGSGAIGIEALSRGAREAVFVENQKKAADCIRENLRFTKLDKAAVVMQCDVFSALSRMDGQKPFEIIFMDPPYDHEFEKQVFGYIEEHRPSYVSEDTLIIAEARKDTDLSYLSQMDYEVVKVKEYKTNKHIFVKLIK